jgi:hypothetical protein
MREANEWEREAAAKKQRDEKRAVARRSSKPLLANGIVPA